MKTLKYSTCNEPEGDPDYTKVNRRSKAYCRGGKKRIC